MTVAMWRVTVIADGVAGGPAYMTGYFSETGGSAAQAATAWFAAVNPSAGGIPVGCTWRLDQNVQLVDDTTGEIISETNVPAASVVGTATSQRLPFTTQLLLQWKTSTFRAGRKVRGRTSIPYRGEDESDASVPNVGCLNFWTPKTVTLLADPNSEFGIYSRVQKDSTGAITRPGLFCPVTTASVWTQWAVLRSRRP